MGLQAVKKYGKLLTVRGGWVVCPECRSNRKLLHIRPDTQAENLPVYCRRCKREIILNIERPEPDAPAAP